MMALEKQAEVAIGAFLEQLFSALPEMTDLRIRQWVAAMFPVLPQECLDRLADLMSESLPAEVAFNKYSLKSLLSLLSITDVTGTPMFGIDRTGNFTMSWENGDWKSIDLWFEDDGKIGCAAINDVLLADTCYDGYEHAADQIAAARWCQEIIQAG